jgi:hypothetical protein
MPLLLGEGLGEAAHQARKRQASGQAGRRADRRAGKGSRQAGKEGQAVMSTDSKSTAGQQTSGEACMDASAKWLLGTATGAPQLNGSSAL